LGLQMRHALHGSQLRRSFIANFEDSAATFVASFGQVDALVTAMQLRAGT